MALAENLISLSMDAEYFEDIIWRLPGAEQIAGYYELLAGAASFSEKEKASKFNNIASNIRECHRYWFFDYFQQQAVKDRKKVYMCHNKFCTNCQKIFAQIRKRKFGPAIDKYAEDYDLYHMTLTLPNCTGSPLINGLIGLSEGQKNELNKTIRHMSKCFKLFIRYLTGNAKTRGVDFSEYGYAGAIRSLECNFKQYGSILNADGSINNNVYHPHYHCIVALKRGLDLPKTQVNKYSHSRRTGEVRYFSDLEILIQKLWRVLVDGIKVTKEALDGLPEGYSCMLDKIAPGNYHEVFKYAIKLDKIKRSDKTKGERLYIPLRNFVDMYYALYKMRTIQGYGIFHNMKFEDVGLDDIEDKLYSEVRRALFEIERPREGVCEHPVEIYTNIKENKCVYISKNNLKSPLNLAGITPEFIKLVGLDKINLPADMLAHPKASDLKCDPEQIKFYKENGILCHEDFDDFYSDEL